MIHRPVSLSAVLCAALSMSCCVTFAGNRNDGVAIQILAINDFHGNIEPPAGSSGRVGTVDAGGAEYLATHIAGLRAANPDRTFVVSAGDLIGASPLISGLFHDEPTIEAMNRIGLDFNAVGNHEFDEGVEELVRMQQGGCHPVDGCLDGDGFEGAQFRFLSANVEQESSGKPLFKRYAIASRGGVKVGFIGLTLEGTPTIVAAAGIRGYRFLDEIESINRVVPELKTKGVDAIVVLIHEGGLPPAWTRTAAPASAVRSSISSTSSTLPSTWSFRATRISHMSVVWDDIRSRPPARSHLAGW